MARRRDGIPFRLLAIVVASLLVVIIVLSTTLLKHAEQAVGEQVRARMLDAACTAAQLLDGDSLKDITAESVGTPPYERAMDTLRAFQESTELSYIYCLQQVDEDTFVYTVDPAVDPAFFGEEAAFTDALDQAGHGVASVDLVAYEDRWGRFYSAYAPVIDSRGDVAAVVGVDYVASWYEERVARIIRIIVANAGTTFVIAALAIIVAESFSRAEARHVKSLLKANRYDPLTGLANMSCFFEEARASYDRRASEGKHPAILYIDMAGMRYFNQRHGFAEGDKLLKSLAILLVAHFGKERCGRFGQDHFVVSTYVEGLDASLETLFADAEDLNDGLNLPLHVGVYPSTMGRVDVSVACDRAKAANKAVGTAYRSGYVIFDESMLRKEEQRHYITDNLDRAIKEGWIEVNYQPIVRAANGKVCDEEALARWRDPKRGLLSPAEFIPALEDAKLIYKLDLCVLEQTLAKMKQLEEAGVYVVPASVNLSRSDFEACDMVEEVRKRVDAAGIDRSMVNVEITETALGRDFDFMKEQVERFHALGFQVWMDDFGSEYSSLDYLQSLTFDLIKLDMRFMRQFDNGDKSKVILTELVRMAIGLGIDTICEGVERQDQVNFLREVGCSKLQGYYFSKPVSLQELLERYEDGSSIGFENPAEAEYFSAVGRVNLYDLSSIAHEESQDLRHYFNTLPMAVFESSGDCFRLTRCNQSYRQFAETTFGDIQVGVNIPFALADERGGGEIIRAMRDFRGRDDRDRLTIDELLPGGIRAHALLRRIAVNPVTGAAAFAVAVLSVTDD